MTVGGRVLCATVDLALDITYVADDFEVGEPNRVDQVHAQAGGKGVNVARLLQQLGRPVTVTGFAGGHVGREIVEHLEHWRLPHRLVHCAAPSRRTVTAFSTGTGSSTGYHEQGPQVSDAEWRGFVDQFDGLVRDASAVVLAGSLPPGIPAHAYAELARGVAAARVPLFMDAPGDLLAEVVRAAKPALVKPNEPECAQATGLALPLSVPQAVEAGIRLRALGAEHAVVSLGVRGLVAATADGALWARPPAVTGNPVGAGDAALAALVHGHLANQPWPERLRAAAAMSAAAVRQPVAGVVDEQDVRELAPLVEVRQP